MPYIFLDESGDLGFDFSKKRTSKYFIITCLFATNKRPIEKIVSKQAVDFVSWSIFRKYQYGNESYYNFIKQKIAEESPLFP